MKCFLTSLVLVALAFVASPAFGQDTQEAKNAASELLKPSVIQEKKVDERSLDQKAAYIMGWDFYSSGKRQGVEFDIEQLKKGIDDAASGAELGMSEEEINSVMRAFQRAIQQKKMEKQKKLAEANMAEGQAFLKANESKPGVKKLENGVQYVVLKEGSGKSPKESDKVKVHYHGTFINGEVFDSSVKPLDGSPPKPAEFPVGGVIKGFSSSLMNMKVGDKWQVFIPSDLAYGPKGRTGIGPNLTLIFELELLDVVANPAAGVAPGGGGGQK